MLVPCQERVGITGVYRRVRLGTGKSKGYGTAETTGRGLLPPSAKGVSERGDGTEGQDQDTEGLEAPLTQILRSPPTTYRTQPRRFSGSPLPPHCPFHGPLIQPSSLSLRSPLSLNLADSC